MSFSASTCLTFAGSTPLGPVLSAYTDTDLYLNPFASVNTSQITGANCPYIFTNIPPGTTNIRLIDPTNSCCITIPIQSDNFCDTCDLDFTTYSSVTNSQIIAGDLTGSCQANISDYVINWFGPNSATNIAFRSGKGNTFSYQFTHPLTGSGFVFAQAGTYTPVIDRVIISGITFSHTGGTGTYDATLDCFDTVQVNPLTCDNGNTPTSVYTHSYYFSGTGASSIPLNVTFQLSANTNYFAYTFTGRSVPDRLIITYSGGTTPSQVILENISIGSSGPATNLSWYAPRNSNGELISRVLCLTGLTRVPGDSLSIQITPNAGNTEWGLNLRCLSSFSCYSCIEERINSSTPYQIILSSITVVTGACATQVGFKLSGCSNDTVVNTGIWNYWSGGGSSPQTPINSFLNSAYSYSLDNNLGIIPRLPSSPVGTVNYSLGTQIDMTRIPLCQNGSTAFDSAASNFACQSPSPSGTISFSKYVTGGTPGTGVIDLTFDNSFWFNHYFNSWFNTMNSTSAQWGFSSCTATTSFYPGALPDAPNRGPFSGGTSANNIPSYSDPSDMRYYRFYRLCLPSASASTPCKGNTTETGNPGFNGNAGGGLIQCYNIHPSSIVTTGITGSNYGMRIVMSKIQNGLTFDPCVQICEFYKNSIINSVNINSTADTNNFTFFSSGPSALTTPFSLRTPVFYENDLSGTIGSFTGACRANFRSLHSSGDIRWYDYLNYTIPQNPSNNSAIFQYSAVTCPNLYRWANPISTSTSLQTGQSTILYLYGYYVELINEPEDGPPIPPFNTAFTQVYRNFNIYTIPITNGVIAGNVTPPGNTLGNVIPNVTNPNWFLIYRKRYGTQEVCNSQYVVGC